ncbi:MAG: Flp family type IVb pilin [Alphaproteobacteria bacterium]|nr:Flp family type IVb pilin [Alphaproteobacteria bacterium]
MKFLKKVRTNEDGATAIEYGLIAALVAIALIAALNQLSGSLSGIFGDVADTLDENAPAAEEAAADPA